MTSKAMLIHPEELDSVWIDQAASLWLKTLALHPWGGANAHQTLEELLQRLETAEYRARIDALCARGITVEYEFHAAGWLLPRCLFEEHPEYFRMDETGARTPKKNFCVSNPQALGMVAKNAAKLTKRLYRSGHRYYFWMDDTKDGGCRCPACRTLSVSDQQLIALNAMLAAMKKEDPLAELSYLAYRESMEPPTGTPEKGIFLEYAPIQRDFTQTVEEAPNEELKQLPALLEKFGTEGAALLEYWYDNSLFSKWKKPPQPFTPNNENIRRDLEFYRSLGFRDIRTFACFLGWDYRELYGAPDLSAYGNE